MRRSVIASWLVLAWLVGVESLALEVPFLTQRVTDLAEVLDPAVEQRLDRKLQAIETETGAQVAVLTVPSLEGEVLEDYSLRVVKSWQLGRHGVDDGVLVLVARDDRKVRIEVGYGLEGTLTDLQSRRIIDGAIAPAFRLGDFGGGIEAAVDSIGGVIRGDPDAIPVATLASKRPEVIGTFGLFLLALIPLGWSTLATPGSRGWILWFGLAPFFFLVPAVLFGHIVGAVVFGLWVVVGGLLRLVLPKSLQHDAGPAGGRSGPWISGGRGGGFSSGGFSGGGGSFGGGGASGGW